jgi:hypothetical protein|nr:MAG TPA_asm: Host cell surface-exposed lipoprotein [Caudoviricetes sp.]
MKLFKTIGIAMLALSICTGCTSYKERVKADNQTEEVELEDRNGFNLSSTTKYELDNVQFHVPNYFKITDKDDINPVEFIADNSDFTVMTLTWVNEELNDSSIDEYTDSFFEKDAFKYLPKDYEIEEKSFKNEQGNYQYYKLISNSGHVILDNQSIYANVNLYFISNNKHNGYGVLSYTQYDGLEYNYYKDILDIVENVSITDEKEEVTSNTTNSTSDSSTTTPAPTPTVGQKNALNSALDYLDNFSFSRQGLIDQLLHDGYTQEEAEYGADHTNANWNEEAALKAMDYLSVMSFSRQRLIEQLMFDGFTQEQAEYGVTQNGY